jgi:scyllo-inositol 2-dehydrogenase (NADP+)
MSDVGVGLLGYGVAGSAFHSPLVAATPGLRLASVASRQKDKVLARYPDATVASRPESVIQDPAVTLVVIATPNETHVPLAEAALDAGKHVVVDKPLALTAADAQALSERAQRRGLLLIPYHNRRWDNDYLTLSQCIDAGLLGEVRTWEAHFDRYRPTIKDSWREEPGDGAGMLYDLGPHLIDQVLCRMGSPASVFADVQCQRDGAQVDDYFHLVLRWGRTRAILHGGALVRGQAPRFAVHGTRGSFVKYGIDPQETALRRGGIPGGPGWGEEPTAFHATVTTEQGGVELTSRVPSIPGDYGAFYRGVLTAIRHGAPPPVSAQAAVDTLRVIEAAQRSAEGGKVEWLNG